MNIKNIKGILGDMKRIKDVLRKLLLIMLLSVIAVILLEFENLQILRYEIKSIFPFLSGKRTLLSNIFLGIFASAFCMYIGEVVNLKHTKNDLKLEIQQVFDEIWVKLRFKAGAYKQDYIRNSQIIIQYQDKIRHLCKEYSSKLDNYYLIVYYLDAIVLFYKAIYENEYMKNSNYRMYKEYIDRLLKAFDGDLKKMYSISVTDEKAMKVRITFEKTINKQIDYENEMNRNTDYYIEEIKKIEETLKKLYDMQLKTIRKAK